MDNESNNNQDNPKRRRSGKRSDVSKENRTIPTSRLKKLTRTSRRSSSCHMLTVSDDDDNDDDAGALNDSRQAPAPTLNHSNRSMSSSGSSARSFSSNISIINNIIDSDKESSCRRSSNNSSNSSLYSNSSGHDDKDYQKQVCVIDDFNSDIEDEDDEELKEEDHAVKVDIRVPINIGDHVQTPVVSLTVTPKNHRNSTRSRCRREGGNKSRSVDRSRRGNRRIGELEHGERSQLETTINTENRKLESEVIQLITDSTKGKIINKKNFRTENLPDKDQYPDKVVSMQNEGISRNSSKSHRSRRQRSSKGRLTTKNRSRSIDCDLLGTSSGYMGRRRRRRSRIRSSSIDNVSAGSREGMKKLSGGTTQSEEETIFASNTHHQTLTDINTTALEDRPFIKETKESSLNTFGKEDDKLESPCQNTSREERRARRLKKLTKERRNHGYSTGKSRKDRNIMQISDRNHHRSSRKLKGRESGTKGQSHKSNDTLENVTRPSEPRNERKPQDFSVCFNDQSDTNLKLNNEDIIKDDLNPAVNLLRHLDRNQNAETQNVTECSVQSRGETTEESQGIGSCKPEDEKRMFDDTRKIENDLHKLDSRSCVKSNTASDDDPISNGTELKDVDLQTVNATNKSNNDSENLLNEKESRNESKKKVGKNAEIATTISDKGKRKSSRKLRQKKKNDVQRNSVSETLVGSTKSTMIDPIHKYKADNSEFNSSDSKVTKVSQLEDCRPRSDKYLGSKTNKKVHKSKEKCSISLNNLFSKSEHSNKEMVPLYNDSGILLPPSLASDVCLLGNTNRSLRNETQIGSAFELDETETMKKSKQYTKIFPSLRSDYNNNSSITDDQVAIEPASSKEKTNKHFSRLPNDLDEHSNFVHGMFDDDNDNGEEHTRKKKRNGMLEKMRKATSTLTESGRTTVKKAASTRNLFEQATLKVFARGKEEGKGLLRSDSD